MTKCKEQLDKKKINNGEGRIEYKSIRSYKLKSRDVSNRFKDVIEQKLQKVSENIRHANIHQGWRIMKDIIIDTAAVSYTHLLKRVTLILF